MSDKRYHVVPTSLDVADGVESISRSTLKLSPNERHWLVFGIAINAVVIPSFRNDVNVKMKTFFNELNLKFRISIQTEDNHLEHDPGNKKVKFEYKSLKINRGKRSKLIYSISDHNELARMYMKDYMAKFASIDDKTCDASAILNIVQKASCFGQEFRKAANDVRELRNDWGHFDEDKWTEEFYFNAFGAVENLVELSGCDQTVSECVRNWKLNGVKLAFGEKIEKETLQEILNAFKTLRQDCDEQLSLKLQRMEAEIASKVDILSDNVSDIRHLALTNESRIEILEQKCVLPRNEKRKSNTDVPNQNGKFTGRHEAMREIQKWIEEVNGLDKFFAICGLGGMGKTTLAAEACWRNREKFPGGIFWLTADDDSSKERNLETSLNKFCLKNNLTSDSSPKVDVVTTFLDSLEEKFLLVVDNLDQREFSVMANKLVNGRWIQNEHIRVLLITTRMESTVIKDKLNFDDCSTLTLQGFSEAEGTLFLERRTGKSTNRD